METDNIDNRHARRIIKSVLWMNSQSNEEITFFINSSGGDVTAGLDIYDILRFSKAPVTGIVIQQASSMALVILQACETRAALLSATFLLHNVIIDIHESIDKIDAVIREGKKNTQLNRDRFYTILSRNTPLKKIKELCNKETILRAEEALHLGLIDKILQLNFI